MAIWKRIRKYKEMDISEAVEERKKETERGDFAAMLISALFTLWLPVVLILLAFGGLIWLLIPG